MPESPQLVARIDFDCIDEECGRTVQFNLMNLEKNDGLVTCVHCHRGYEFDEDFRQKLGKPKTLVLSVKDAEDILGNVNIAVTTPAGEVKIPYQLLLTRLNTLITLDVSGRKIDFNFRIEPLNDGTFK